MNIEVTELERWRRRLTVTVPADSVKVRRGQALKRLSGRLNLKGFRKGKVPAGLVARRYGPAVEQEVLEQVIQESYRNAVQQQELHPISEGELGEVDYESGSDLRFAIEFDVQPDIALPRVGGFAVARPHMDITGAQVDEVLEQVRKQNGAWSPREEGMPEAGDLVSVEIQRLDGEGESEAQSYEFTLGQGDAIPDVEDAIRSLEVEKSDEFTVTFPDDFPNEERRGQSERLRIQLAGRRVLELPELDDAFAKSLGEFETLDDLKARIQEDLEKEAEQRAENAVRSELLDFVVDANPFEVPQSMVGRYVDSLLGGAENVTPERRQEAVTALGAEAEHAVKRILVIERIAELHELTASEDEMDARVEAIAEDSGTTPAQVYAQLQKGGRLGALERELTESKVFDFLKSQSEITDAA